ncbi:Ribosomal protein S12 methylthiotransferase RimO [Collinsella intestinalis]|uniref:Ribosomal protein S12 methylthiotransferase RimO n=1 Tax=Collinsella intestinalis TaxID=147207 RepID=A0A5K1IXM4_9ACTN|nr:YgiQ family radical SAM protein [Collinsella intestinalis]VWL93560.1 Ribosomal protein S12 methylthiotransferase RimO [Collinsella intestinalis]
MPKHPPKNHAAPKGPKPKHTSTPARCPGTKGRPGREAFLPVSRDDMEARGWDQCDFVYICGDAYVDHPSFGMAIISRVLEHAGYRVGIICQPDWTDPASIAALGEPRLGFLISAGNMDSMVNHYTVNKKPRHEDAYTPGGRAGARPNRAVTVYGNLIRRTFKDKPIIIGGIEASLRRLAHYDYWQDKLKRSVLLDSGADILLYGMGEHSIVEVADALDGGLPVDQITFVNGSVYRTSGAGALDNVFDYELLPSWDELERDRLTYARSFNIQQQNMDPITGGRLVEPYPNGVYVVQNPPSAPLTEREMDEVAELPYARHWHPDYDVAGGIPAFDEIRFSISSNRGCFGECSFCALAFHQGRMVQVRSRESIMREAEALTHDPEFKGYINDVGGPTANFFKPACKKQLTHGVCKNRRCLWPNVCRNMDTNEDAYAELLRDLRQIPGVKKVFVRSGIRFDYTMADASDKFLVELLQHHVSGQLRLAPEHVSDAVLSVMGKPRREVYDAFVERFERLSAEYGLKQYVVPYLISSHPGSTMKEAVELAEAVRDMGYMPEQVQDFYPTPSTMSTCMFYTGVDPRTMEPVYIPRDPHEKAMQRALIQYRKPENYKLVKEALRKAGREDLIGYGSKCLIRPVPPKPGAGGGKKQVGSGAGKPANGTSKRATSRHEDGKAATQPQNRAERRAAARSGKKGATMPSGRTGAKQNGRPNPGKPGGRATGKSAAGTNPHARNRAAQGRQGANRH